MENFEKKLSNFNSERFHHLNRRWYNGNDYFDYLLERKDNRDIMVERSETMSRLTTSLAAKTSSSLFQSHNSSLSSSKIKCLISIFNFGMLSLSFISTILLLSSLLPVLVTSVRINETSSMKMSSKINININNNAKQSIIQNTTATIHSHVVSTTIQKSVLSSNKDKRGDENNFDVTDLNYHKDNIDNNDNGPSEKNVHNRESNTYLAYSEGKKTSILEKRNLDTKNIDSENNKQVDDDSSIKSGPIIDKEDREKDDDGEDDSFSSPVIHFEKAAWMNQNNNNDDNGEDYEDDDDTNESNSSKTNICTAGYFFDRIIPEDYPHEISKEVKHINETIERLNRMYMFSNKMMERLNPFIREIVSRMSDYLYESQLDSECMGALFRVFRAINQRKSWAMNFLDASGSIFVGGFQQGMFVSLGEFDQCLEIESDPTENSNLIYGQYCLLKPVVPLPENIKQGEPIAQSRIPRVKTFLNDEYIDTYLGLYKFMKRTFLRVGLCLPHICQSQNLENAINRILVRKTGMSVQVGPECVKATDITQFNIYQIITLSLLVLLIILVFLSTTYEIVYRHMFENRNSLRLSSSAMGNDNYHPDLLATRPYNRSFSTTSRISKLYFDKPIIVQVLTSFSIIRNTRYLFDQPSPERYPQIDTMRLLLIIFFFISNAYYYTLVFAPMIIKRFYVQGPMQFVSEKKYFFIRMYYLIDCFVVFSGIALAVSFQPKTFTYVRYLLRNYIRYTLPIMVSIGLIYVVPLFGSGPLWHLFDQTMTQPCKDSVWSTLFFTNNFHNNIEEICNLPTVFVSMIFQLKIFAPIILLTNSHLHPKIGTLFYLFLLMLASIASIIYRFYYDFKVPYEYHLMKSFMEIKQSVMFYFFNPFCHLQPFIVGLLVGHLITTRRMSNSKFVNTFIGIVCLASFLLCFFYTENLDLLHPQISSFQLVLVLTIGRLMLVSLHAWIIYASVKGHITIVNRFLSSIAFRPMSQLSYGFFLTSIIVTCYRLFSIRQTIILSAQTMFRSIVSDAVISFLFAYFMHIMVQQPMRNILHICILWKKIFPMTPKNSFSVSEEHHPGSYFVQTLSSFQNKCEILSVMEEVIQQPNGTDASQKEVISNSSSKMVMLNINNENLDLNNNGNELISS